MKRAFLMACVLALTAALTARADDQKVKPAGDKAKPVVFIIPQATTTGLDLKRLKVIEVTSEPGPTVEFNKVLGAQGEPPVPAGKYVPQTVVIDLEGNQRVQANALFATALPKGKKFTSLRPRGAFTAESGKEMLQLMAFDAEPKR